MLSTDPSPDDIFDAYLAGATYTELSEHTGQSETALWTAMKRVGRQRQVLDRARIAAEARENRTQDFVSMVGRLAGEVFKLNPGELWGDRRYRMLVRARQAVFLVCVENRIPTAGIGRAFEMDHTTICHGRDKARALVAKNPDYAALVDKLHARVRAEMETHP